MLQAGRSWVQIPMRSLNFFNLPKPSSRTMALGFIQRWVSEKKSICIFPGSRARPAHKADNLTDCLDNVGSSTSHNPNASTACYRDNFFKYKLSVIIVLLRLTCTWGDQYSNGTVPGWGIDVSMLQEYPAASPLDKGLFGFALCFSEFWDGPQVPSCYFVLLRQSQGFHFFKNKLFTVKASKSFCPTTSYTNSEN
jgi:hypothetical protein